MYILLRIIFSVGTVLLAFPIAWIFSHYGNVSFEHVLISILFISQVLDNFKYYFK